MKLITVVVLLAAISSLYAEEVPLEKGLDLYRENQLEKALPFLREAVRQEPLNADAHAWLAETLRRLRQHDEAVEEATQALVIDPCHSFAHTILGDARNPMYSSWKGVDAETNWEHLLKAIDCNPNDGGAWTSIWSQAIMRGDREMERKAARALIERGFLTDAVLAYNRWMLRNLPKDAILLTNGDMDTYPAVALQEVEGFRKDVGVVNLALLNTPWYARMVRSRYEVPLPFDDDDLDTAAPFRDENGKIVTISKQIVRGWFDMQREGKLGRPLAVAVTVSDTEFTPDSEDRLQMAGPYALCHAEPPTAPQDTTVMRLSIAEIDPKDFEGPFVSETDRSPVRRAGSDRLVTNITAVALRYGHALLDAGRASEAYELAQWAAAFEARTNIGLVSGETIKDLKETAGKKME